MISLSTAWNYRSAHSLEEMLIQIRSLGFSAVELGYSFTEKHLDELIPLLKSYGFAVSSVHSFCPFPEEKASHRHPSACYLLSSLDSKENSLALQFTKKTIDTAARVGAPYVIVHGGVVEMPRDILRRMMSLYFTAKNLPEYEQVKQQVLNIREQQKQPFFSRLIDTLAQIMDYAYSRGVGVGIENRYYPNEIPNIEEIDYLLNSFSRQGMVYWHDVGHAEVNERLGISMHLEYLQRFADYLKGMHIHDVLGISDHRAPYSGEVDFSKIRTYIDKAEILVIEAHGKSDLAQMQYAVRKLKEDQIF